MKYEACGILLLRHIEFQIIVLYSRLHYVSGNMNFWDDGFCTSMGRSGKAGSSAPALTDQNSKLTLSGQNDCTACFATAVDNSDRAAFEGIVDTCCKPMCDGQVVLQKGTVGDKRGSKGIAKCAAGHLLIPELETCKAAKDDCFHSSSCCADVSTWHTSMRRF